MLPMPEPSDGNLTSRQIRGRQIVHDQQPARGQDGGCELVAVGDEQDAGEILFYVD